MKVFVHQGSGHYVGSCVVVVAESDEQAKDMIRMALDNMGLPNEQLDVKAYGVYSPKVIVEISGDY